MESNTLRSIAAAAHPVLPPRSSRRKQGRAERFAMRGTGVPLVYYLAVTGDKVKIGYSGNVARRCHEHGTDPTFLLAVEPGGFLLEQKRHREFAESRHGANELFDRTPELMEHVERIKAAHGDPVAILVHAGLWLR